MRIDLTNEDMKTLCNINEQISKSRVKQIVRKESNNVWEYLKDKIKEAK